ncbi:thioredoxin family protein [Candidatus Parcubacteria bacterium]|nr:thioredoxin family protein [Candidatus Parcubacteria bacterium]
MKVLKIGEKGCEDCETMVPRWQEIEKEYPWLKTEYIERDEHPEIVEKYNLLAIPSFIFLNKNGEEILRFSKIVEKDVLIKAILENKDR